MARFIDDHHLKLQYHPMFAAVYHSRSSSIPMVYTYPIRGNGTSNSTRQIQCPPLDWRTVGERLRALDALDKALMYYDIIQGFCSSYDNITLHCQSNTAVRDVTIEGLAGSVQLMSKLAINMFEATARGLSKLRDCMSTLCAELAKYSTSEIANGLDWIQRKRVLEGLCKVEQILKGESTGVIYQSGIEKVTHLF
jgi:hypothetical protein